jgi:hypothetical protein
LKKEEKMEEEKYNGEKEMTKGGRDRNEVEGREANGEERRRKKRKEGNGIEEK